MTDKTPTLEEEVIRITALLKPEIGELQADFALSGGDSRGFLDVAVRALLAVQDLLGISVHIGKPAEKELFTGAHYSFLRVLSEHTVRMIQALPSRDVAIAESHIDFAVSESYRQRIAAIRTEIRGVLPLTNGESRGVLKASLQALDIASRCIGEAVLSAHPEMSARSLTRARALDELGESLINMVKEMPHFS